MREIELLLCREVTNRSHNLLNGVLVNFYSSFLSFFLFHGWYVMNKAHWRLALADKSFLLFFCWRTSSDFPEGLGCWDGSWMNALLLRREAPIPGAFGAGGVGSAPPSESARPGHVSSVSQQAFLRGTQHPALTFNRFPFTVCQPSLRKDDGLPQRWAPGERTRRAAQKWQEPGGPSWHHQHLHQEGQGKKKKKKNREGQGGWNRGSPQTLPQCIFSSVSFYVVFNVGFFNNVAIKWKILYVCKMS